MASMFSKSDTAAFSPDRFFTFRGTIIWPSSLIVLMVMTEPSATGLPSKSVNWKVLSVSSAQAVLRAKSAVIRVKIFFMVYDV